MFDAHFISCINKKFYIHSRVKCKNKNIGIKKHFDEEFFC